MSEKLPMAGPATAGTATALQAGSDGDDPSVPPTRPPTSAGRLVATLSVAGALAGLVIVLVHQWSQPRIQAHQARVLAEAIQEVLGAPERTETLFLHDGTFSADAPPADTASLDRIYAGYGGDGSLVGVAAVAGEPGFQDIIRLIFGYDPTTGQVLGMKVLESKETPGLGDKIEKDSSFVAEFSPVDVPLVGVKSGAGTGAPGEVDMITGATISSRAIIDIINHRLEALEAPLRGLAGHSAGVITAPGPPAVRQGGAS